MPTNSAFDALIDSPVGVLGIRISGDSLTGIEFLGQHATGSGKTGRHTEILRRVRSALEDYFSAAETPIDIKIDQQGTEFQNKVWAILRSIPVGQTRTYGDIARQLGSSPRAVGNACQSNPVPIFVPCHRVISAHGTGGFMGSTSGQPMAIKHWLLEHERAH